MMVYKKSTGYDIRRNDADNAYMGDQGIYGRQARQWLIERKFT